MTDLVAVAEWLSERDLHALRGVEIRRLHTTGNLRVWVELGSLTPGVAFHLRQEVLKDFSPFTETSCHVWVSTDEGILFQVVVDTTVEELCEFSSSVFGGKAAQETL